MNFLNYDLIIGFLAHFAKSNVMSVAKRRAKHQQSHRLECCTAQYSLLAEST